MTLYDLFKKEINNQEKYHFVLFYRNYDFINTNDRITYRDFRRIIGLSIVFMEIDNIYKGKDVIKIKLKDS